MIAPQAEMPADTRNAWCVPSSKDAKISAVAFNSSAVKKDVIQDFFGKPAGTSGNAIAIASM